MRRKWEDHRSDRILDSNCTRVVKQLVSMEENEKIRQMFVIGKKTPGTDEGGKRKRNRKNGEHRN